jgi:hypothetical protein
VEERWKREGSEGQRGGGRREREREGEWKKGGDREGVGVRV